MEKFRFLDKDKINQLPKTSGVYAFRGGKEILYIGKAANIRERVKNHFQQPGFHNGHVLARSKHIAYVETYSEVEALILEANLIKKHQPKYNVTWRDDKNYFYICITKEEFPRVLITHQTCPEPAERVGPFVDGGALKQTLKILRRVFPYRTCKTLPKRPCLWYQLERCPAPCLLKSDKSSLLHSKIFSARARGKMKKICQGNTKNLMKILRGKKGQVLKNLKKEMEVLSKVEKFEEAAKIRNQILALEKVLAHTMIFDSAETPYLKPWPWQWQWFQVRRIEGYDVSNIQGDQATGAMVTFINGKPEKKLYRKFKIKIAEGPNDVAMIKEILSRRFRHPEWGRPDLILIDGGKAHLNAALRCLEPGSKHFGVVALAKKENKLYIEGRRKPILLKSLSREIFNLILQLRDEAHRFARSYHHKLREVDLVRNV